MVAAITVLIKDAGKLTLGQPMTILVLHAIESTIRQLPDHWLSNAHLTHYQSLLLDADRIQFGPMVNLNPAILLPLLEGGTSAQQEELIVLTQALQLAARKKLNVYTDS